MNNQKHIFLILAISWGCFVIGCAITIAYLSVSSDYQSRASSTEAVEAMKIQKQEEDAANVDAEDISASMKSFLNAYYQKLLEGDRTQLIQMVEDPDSFYSEEQLRKMNAYVESYQNVHYYIQESSSEEGAVIVFVSYQTKLYDIETTVPGIAQYFIKKMDGEWMIFNNEEHLSEASQKEMKASLRLPKIEQLIIETNQQYQKALKKDTALKEYFEE